MPDESIWKDEAQKKGLPEKWVETLDASDGFTEAQKRVFVDHLTGAADWDAKRKAAVEMGRRYGEDEANRRGETGHNREQRIKRAMAYAAWEFDGKPLSSKAQREEMGVLASDIPSYADQAAMWMKRGEQ